jgi:hypothetical protein
VTFLSCRLQISLTLDFRIFLGTHVFEFECHYNLLPNIHNSTSWVLFFCFLFFFYGTNEGIHCKEEEKSIIVHHQGDKGVWPHTWPCPSTNKASLLGLLYTPSNTSTSPNAHHFICPPQILSKHGRCFNCIGLLVSLSWVQISSNSEFHVHANAHHAHYTKFHSQNLCRTDSSPHHITAMPSQTPHSFLRTTYPPLQFLKL